MRSGDSGFAAKAGAARRRRQAKAVRRMGRLPGFGMEELGTSMATGAYPYYIDRA
jgi:hypothetical protein